MICGSSFSLRRTRPRGKVKTLAHEVAHKLIVLSERPWFDAELAAYCYDLSGSGVAWRMAGFQLAQYSSMQGILKTIEHEGAHGLISA